MNAESSYGGVQAAKLWPRLDTRALHDAGKDVGSSATQRFAVSEHRSWRADVVPGWRESSSAQQLEAMEARDPLSHTIDPLLDVVRSKEGGAPLTATWHDRSTNVWRGTSGVMASPRPDWRDHMAKLWQPARSGNTDRGKLPATPSPYLPPFADAIPDKAMAVEGVDAVSSKGTLPRSQLPDFEMGVCTSAVGVETSALEDEEAWRASVAWNRKSITADRKEREAEADKRALAERRLELTARAERARLHAVDMRRNVDDHIALTLQTSEYRAWAALPRISREKKHEEAYGEKLKDYTARIFAQCT